MTLKEFTKLDELEMEDMHSSLSVANPLVPRTPKGEEAKVTPDNTDPDSISSTKALLAISNEPSLAGIEEDGGEPHKVQSQPSFRRKNAEVIDPNVCQCMLFWVVWLAIAGTLLFLKLTT
mmetsp:Transcript_16329/g.31700  ORF Transcript_16329/g.31700 Transcript_16329/m.31700 type:complete len:120 (-) Transcript_16329:269-628(-)|eukprot:CAMPEP_0171526186 /NCGR_PEP_ID=MMETSP0959-20130129/10230_1 /TAXON_ID=87120 /ORGANISM="Aurantiochytrium limacinum, Strain ATCCMYA-1381" /LENGTH=119 /DNA_ID=CAMNT_0012067535 /DNA_START=129 /DNA_END=488 /DNA_ORIENTATION=-